MCAHSKRVGGIGSVAKKGVRKPHNDWPAALIIHSTKGLARSIDYYVAGRMASSSRGRTHVRRAG